MKTMRTKDGRKTPILMYDGWWKEVVSWRHLPASPEKQSDVDGCFVVISSLLWCYRRSQYEKTRFSRALESWFECQSSISLRRNWMSWNWSANRLWLSKQDVLSCLLFPVNSSQRLLNPDKVEKHVEFRRILINFNVFDVRPNGECQRKIKSRK